MKIKQILILCLYLSLSAAFVTGCDSGTDDNTPTDVHTYAKAGSTFDFAGYDKDSSYNKIPGSDTTWRDSVVSGPVAFDGKTHVITVYRGESDSSVFAYEQNGDISLYLPNGLDEQGIPIEGIGAGWWQIPFGSKKTNDTLFVVDTNITIQGFPASISMSGVTSYVGTGTFTLSGQSFDTKRAKVIVTVTIDAGIMNFSVTNEIVVDYAPKLGYIVQQDSKQTQPPTGGDDVGGSYEVLMAYSLK